MSTRLDRRLAAKVAKKAFIKNNWGEWNFKFPRFTQAGLDIPYSESGLTQACFNLVFSVQEYQVPGAYTRLMVRRHDQQRIQWAELQRIKNELYGEEVLGIQCFPRQSKLVDVAMMYWMYLIPESEREQFESRLILKMENRNGTNQESSTEGIDRSKSQCPQEDDLQVGGSSA